VSEPREPVKPRIGPGQHIRWPILGAPEREAVLRVLERNVLSGPFAPEVRALEKEFAQYLGVKHCLATNSGTAALHLALAAAGVGPGDEVITSAFTFVATPLSVLHQNAIPVFVDIEPKTLGVDPALVEKAITPRTKALMPVHIHGTPCELDALTAIAKKRNLPIIEDACQAAGAEHNGKKLGSFGAAGCFSLQSSKSFACGEGGLFVTDDDGMLDRANRTRMFGENVRFEDEKTYRVDRPLDGDRAYDSQTMGWMYRITELSAAVARAQLQKVPELTLQAQRNASYLSKRLGALPGVTPPYVAPGDSSSFHKYRLRLDGTKAGVDASPKKVRDAVLAALKADGVDAVLWQSMPVPAQKVFRDKVGYGKGCPWDHGAPVSYELSQYPETVRLLDSSIVLFSQSHPIAGQPMSLCEAYADAFEAVWKKLGDLVK
jgi:dTDP-4-amino-4,6-dideoxygalactose transaminase